MCEPAAFACLKAEIAAPCPQGVDQIPRVDDIALQHLRRFSNWLNSMQKLSDAYFLGNVPMRVRRPDDAASEKVPSFLDPNGRSQKARRGRRHES
jgi:hypothetical protein